MFPQVDIVALLQISGNSRYARHAAERPASVDSPQQPQLPKFPGRIPTEKFAQFLAKSLRFWSGFSSILRCSFGRPTITDIALTWAQTDSNIPVQRRANTATNISRSTLILVFPTHSRRYPYDVRPPASPRTFFQILVATRFLEPVNSSLRSLLNLSAVPPTPNSVTPDAVKTSG
jgi:hypothetical protein